MTSNGKNKSSFSWYKILILVFISSFLFIIANPNFVLKKGLGFLAWFYYVPVFILISKINLKQSLITGFLYGLISYGGYAYWLCNSYLAAYFLIILYFGVLHLVLFFLLKSIELLFKKEAWIVQCLLICSFEYVKTLGFLGFSYGTTVYTQWTYKIIIQICDIIGAFGLNLILIFTSGLIFSYGKKIVLKRQMIYQKDINQNHLKRYLVLEKQKKETSLTLTIIVTVLILSLIIFDLSYGFLKIREKKEYKTLKICTVQSMDDPWKTGFESYDNNVKVLKKLSDEALELYPDLEMIIWPETAVVPAIVYNYKNKKDPNRYELSKSLLKYIESKNVQFVIGNGHKEKINGGENRNYNAALIFNPGVNVLPPEPEIYAKIHLVPFTENFPFRKHFSFIYKKLIKNGLVFWNPGENVKVFTNGDFIYSTPICFEDTFGNVCRKMVMQGARAFVNLTNDYWAKSESGQNQHLAMAIIRSVENRVPTVRCTNSGQTCVIDEKGKIQYKLDSFVTSYMIGEVDILDKQYKATFYTKTGDFAGWAPIIILLFVLLIKVILVKINKTLNQ